MPKNMLGPLFILIASVLWSFSGVGVRFMPWGSFAIISVRGLFAALTIAIIQRQWKVKLTLPTVGAALCIVATSTLFVTANQLTTAANAIVLQYTAPIYVLIISIIVTKMKPRRADIITIVLALLGISLFFIDHLGRGALIGDMLALLSGLTMAGIFFLSGMPGANPRDTVFLGCALSALLLPALFFEPQVIYAGPIPWVVVILLGIFQLGLAYCFFAKGIKLTGPVTASIICAAEPILNPIWVLLLTGETPGMLSIIGAVVVIGTICWYNAVTAKQEYRVREAEG